jgi:GH25 family lysozyme M1 (1,4-beta-N-acetylmuramidase)
MSETYYPDISHWNPIVNWDEAEKCGFIISKATQGTSYIDPTLDSFISGCEKHHIPYWLYVYLNKGNELAQTKFMVAVCKNRVGDYFQGYALDIEANNPESNCITALNWLKTQCKRTMIYTGWVDRSMYKNLIAGRGDTQWWEARYGRNDGKYNPKYPCHDGVDLHQYTSNGYCPGTKNGADMNRIVEANPSDFMPSTEPESKPTAKGYTGTWPAFETGRDCYKEGDGIVTMRNYPTQIKRVQSVLRWVTGEKIAVDGKYGAKTAAVCRKAQEIIGATVDGIFGPQTLRMAKTYTK